jgi:hypothetical protein
MVRCCGCTAPRTNQWLTRLKPKTIVVPASDYLLGVSLSTLARVFITTEKVLSELFLD